jgi:uncharacterized protein (TIGR02186 family)
VIARIRLAALALLAFAQPALPETERVVASISQNRISITAGFVGSEIFVYGAIDRDAPAADGAAPLGVVIQVSGPSQPLTVRRKERIAGIWVNADSARIDAAPSFYAVATTGPLHETISHTEDLRHGVSLERALRFVDAGAGAEDREAFLDAAVRLRRARGLYVVAPGGVRLIDDVLFDTSVSLPANIVEGVYDVRVFLTRERRVIDDFSAEIVVRKEGFERLVYVLSREQPALYGALSIAVALAAGLGAAEVFRYLRR